MNEDLEIRIREIFRCHYEDIYHFLVYFTGNRNEAEDLTQEVFIRLLHALPSYHGLSSMKTWIFAIARNVAVDHHRKQKFSFLSPDKWLKRVSSTSGKPEEELEKKELHGELYEALKRLKPNYRTVIILRGLKEYSVKETAQILGCSESKVKVDYHRALKLLENHISSDLFIKVGVTHELGW
ncbi:MAG: RNA polymerase sigma factor [Clostridia bacterium]